MRERPHPRQLIRHCHVHLAVRLEILICIRMHVGGDVEGALCRPCLLLFLQKTVPLELLVELLAIGSGCLELLSELVARSRVLMLGDAPLALDVHLLEEETVRPAHHFLHVFQLDAVVIVAVGASCALQILILA